MDAIVYKHFFSKSKSTIDEASLHATITKDTAVGFAEWIDHNYWRCDQIGESPVTWKLSPFSDDDEFYTTSELYDIYVKSLEGS